MKINARLGVFVFCGITALAVTADLPSFIDLASLLMVMGGSIWLCSVLKRHFIFRFSIRGGVRGRRNKRMAWFSVWCCDDFSKCL